MASSTRVGSRPICTIPCPSGLHTAAYCMSLFSAVLGVISWHSSRLRSASMGRKKRICSPELKL